MINRGYTQNARNGDSECNRLVTSAVWTVPAFRAKVISAVAQFFDFF